MHKPSIQRCCSPDCGESVVLVDEERTFKICEKCKNRECLHCKCKPLADMSNLDPFIREHIIAQSRRNAHFAFFFLLCRECFYSTFYLLQVIRYLDNRPHEERNPPLIMPVHGKFTKVNPILREIELSNCPSCQETFLRVDPRFVQCPYCLPEEMRSNP